MLPSSSATHSPAAGVLWRAQSPQITTHPSPDKESERQTEHVLLPTLLIATRCLALANLAALGFLFVSAGLFVQDSRGLGVHGLAAIGIHVTSGFLAVTLILFARATKTGLVPAVLAVALFGLTFLQALLGSAMTLTQHVSGALVLTVMATWLTAWAFSCQRRSTAGRSSESRSDYLEGAPS